MRSHADRLRCRVCLDVFVDGISLRRIGQRHMGKAKRQEAHPGRRRSPPRCCIRAKSSGAGGSDPRRGRYPRGSRSQRIRSSFCCWAFPPIVRKSTASSANASRIGRQPHAHGRELLRITVYDEIRRRGADPRIHQRSRRNRQGIPAETIPTASSTACFGRASRAIWTNRHPVPAPIPMRRPRPMISRSRRAGGTSCGRRV